MRLKDKFNRKYMQISLYVIITCVIIYSLSKIADNAPVIVRKVMDIISWILKVIKPLILGFVIAYLMDPIVCFFERKFRKYRLFKLMKNYRTWATVIAVSLLMLAIAGLISLLVFSVTDQLRLANFDDIIQLADEYMNSLKAFYESIVGKMEELDIESQEMEQYVKNAATYVLDSLVGIAENTVSSIKNISNYMTTIIFSFIIGFYFMIDGRMFMDYLKKVFKALFTEHFNMKTMNVVHDVDHVFSGYIRGQLTDALVMMVLISLTLSITGVKFAIVIGIFAGIGNLIPYFGPIVAYIGTTIVCLINGDTKTLFVSIIALIFIQFLDGNMIGPKLLSRSIKIHPLIIIISLIFGNAIGGFLGMLLAVPTGAYIKLVFARHIEHRIIRKEGLEMEPVSDTGEGKSS